MLALAAMNNDTNKIREYVVTGVDINSHTALGFTPLMWAVDKGHGEATKLLLELGADVNKVDLDGRNIVHVACRSVPFNKSILSMLVEKGANINQKDKQGNCPLNTSCRFAEGAWLSSEREKAARLLIELGANVNIANDNGQTPIYRAIYAGNQSLVDLLIKGGSSIGISDKDGKTPTSQRSFCNFFFRGHAAPPSAVMLR